MHSQNVHECDENNGSQLHFDVIVSGTVPMQVPSRIVSKPTYYNKYCICAYNKKCIFKCLVVVNIFVLIWTCLSYRNLPEYKVYSQHKFILSKGSIKIKSCSLPKLEPFPEEILLHLKNIDNINCARIATQLGEIGFYTVRGSQTLVQDDESLQECCYRPFSRESDNSVKLSKDCYSIKSNVTEIPEEHEFIEVLCVQRGQDYRDGFAFVPVKPHLEEKLEYVENLVKFPANSRLSVIILGLDATSHMNFLRMLPKTHQYLTEELSMITMNGYTKVGENSLPNIIPLLSGMHLNKFKANCIDPTDSPSRVRLDECPFIWKKFSSQGYRTSFAEDDVNIGIFNLDWPNAFYDPPTDYYLRPFSYRMEKARRNTESNDGNFCYGPRLSFKVLLDNMENMAETFRDKLYFQFTWSTKLSHNDFNKLILGDSELLSTLKFLKMGGYLNNSVLILISDHGSRVDTIRETPQGQIEDRMPFVHFVLPPWFPQKYPKAVANMKWNSQIVTSAFDVHETLTNFMDLRQIEDSYLVQDEDVLEQIQRRKLGTSLFKRLNKNRSCHSTGIPAHWCLCHSKYELITSSSIVKDATKFIVGSLNSLIHNYNNNSKLCAHLTLSTINTAWQFDDEELEYEEFISNENTTSTRSPVSTTHFTVLQVSFTTSPGDGTFEATVFKHPEKGWMLTEQVVRTNSYEGKANCAVQRMKEYCHCTVKTVRE